MLIEAVCNRIWAATYLILRMLPSPGNSYVAPSNDSSFPAVSVVLWSKVQAITVNHFILLFFFFFLQCGQRRAILGTTPTVQ